MSWKKFKEGFVEGRDGFASLTSTIVNSVVLSIVYVFGVGLTSLFAKIVKKDFLDLNPSKESKTYWEDLNLGKREDRYYYRQF